MTKHMNKSDTPENSYIISVIDGTGYDVSPITAEEKLRFCFETFQSEYGWRVKQVGMLTALSDWLSGLLRLAILNFAITRLLSLLRNGVVSLRMQVIHVLITI